MAEYVPFSSRIFGFLSILEKVAITGALVGIGFKYLQLPGADQILMISLSGLAGVYFMFAYKPPQTMGEEKPGFNTSLSTVILPKVASIASSVLVIAIMFRFLPLQGAKEMLMVGVAGGVFAAMIFGLLLVQGNEAAKSQVGILYRLLPLLIIAAYFLLPQTV
jgi:hypothetical protein